MHNLIEYSDDYTKTSGSLWQYCRDEPADKITDSKSFKLKSRFLNKADNTGTLNVKLAAPLNYLSNFWKTFEMSLIYCEMDLILTWSANCIICEVNRPKAFAITDP